MLVELALHFFSLFLFNSFRRVYDFNVFILKLL